MNTSYVDRTMLSVHSFCERYNIGRTKTYELLNSGQLDALKIGGRTLIPLEAAERWASTLPSWTPVARSSRAKRGGR